MREHESATSLAPTNNALQTKRVGVPAWHEGGKTNAANSQMLCKDDNRRQSGK
jgi:hypothetical protein